jgi:excisionase family DNA binding protein
VPVQPRRLTRGDLPLLLTAEETAEILRTTRQAIYIMAARGQLPGVTRIGRRLLVRSEDLLTWIDQKRTPSGERAR